MFVLFLTNRDFESTLGVENRLGERGTKTRCVNFRIIIFYRSQDYRQKCCKFLNMRGYFLTKHSLRNMNQIRMSRGRTEKDQLLLGELKHWYRTDLNIRCQRWLEPMLIQSKTTSSTIQYCMPFQ